jgi:hypothetical protein
MNLYFEKNVINEKMRDNPAKGKKYEVLRIVVTVIMLVLVLVLANTLPWSNSGWMFNIAIFAAVIAPSVTIILFCGQQLKKHCCEYDYIIANNEIKVIRIFNQKKRETILTFDISNIERLGFASETEEYQEYEKKADKKCLAFCNSNENYLYVFGSVKSLKTLLVCEFDADYVTALKKSVASYGVFSEEFKKFKG